MRPIVFVLGHGPRGRSAATRAAELLGSTVHVVAIDDPADTEERLDAVASEAASGTTLRVVHLVEVEDDAVRLGLAGATAAVRDAMKRFQALVFVQFVVAMVDRDWDEDELATLMGLGDAVAAVLVVSRSNEFVVQLRPEEEECMAADIAHALAVSNLGNGLDTDRYWLAGASAVHYRRAALVAALEAYHVRGFVRDDLLADLPASHTVCAEGEVWVRSSLLGAGDHLRQLEKAPLGGSVLSDIRIGRDLFRTVAPELLVDTLLSFAQQNADELVGRAREQVERNRAEHLTEVTRALTAATRDILTRRPPIVAAARRFVECARDEVGRVLQGIQTALSDALTDSEADVAEQEAVERELVRTIRRLPYPAALVARALGLGALGIAAYHLLAVSASLDPNFAVLGLLAGLAFAGPLFVQFRWRLDRIESLRERYLVLAERRVRSRVAQIVLETAASELQELQRLAVGGEDSLGGRLDELRKVLTQLLRRYDARVADRVVGGIQVARLSILLPSVEDLSTATLAEQFPVRPDFDLPGLVMGCLIRDRFPQPPTVEELDAALLSGFEPAIQGALWRDLADLLKESPAAAETAGRVLGTPTAPIVRRDELSADTVGVRRLATVPASHAHGLEAVLSATAVDGRLATQDPDSVVQVSIRPVPASMRRGGGDG